MAYRTTQMRQLLTARCVFVQDGTQLQFKSVAQNRYLAAEQGGGGAIVADREQPSGWETFKVSRRKRNEVEMSTLAVLFSLLSELNPLIWFYPYMMMDTHAAMEDRRDDVQLPRVRQPVRGRRRRRQSRRDGHHAGALCKEYGPI